MICDDAADACTGGAGYDAGMRKCVPAGSVNNATHCRAAGKVLLSGENNCASMCDDNEAPGSDGRGRCRAATTACLNGQGYNSSTKVCISVAVLKTKTNVLARRLSLMPRKGAIDRGQLRCQRGCLR